MDVRIGWLNGKRGVVGPWWLVKKYWRITSTPYTQPVPKDSLEEYQAAWVN